MYNFCVPPFSLLVSLHNLEKNYGILMCFSLLLLILLFYYKVVSLFTPSLLCTYVFLFNFFFLVAKSLVTVE